ncbi:hypothetical protein BDV06DRAFT_202478 [Aspergillus oleicola]
MSIANDRMSSQPHDLTLPPVSHQFKILVRDRHHPILHPPIQCPEAGMEGSKNGTEDAGSLNHGCDTNVRVLEADVVIACLVGTSHVVRFCFWVALYWGAGTEGLYYTYYTTPYSVYAIQWVWKMGTGHRAGSRWLAGCRNQVIIRCGKVQN